MMKWNRSAALLLALALVGMVAPMTALAMARDSDMELPCAPTVCSDPSEGSMEGWDPPPTMSSEFPESNPTATVCPPDATTPLPESSSDRGDESWGSTSDGNGYIHNKGSSKSKEEPSQEALPSQSSGKKDPAGTGSAKPLVGYALEPEENSVTFPSTAADEEEGTTVCGATEETIPATEETVFQPTEETVPVGSNSAPKRDLPFWIAIFLAVFLILAILYVIWTQKNKECPVGHIYDGTKHRRCPICASAAVRETTEIPNLSKRAEIHTLGNTTEFYPLPKDLPESAVGTGQTIFSTEFHGKQIHTQAPPQVEIPDYPGNYQKPPKFPKKPGTVILPHVGGAAGTDPAVGWLICISGPSKGKEFRIVSGCNYIGRSSKMHISIPDDPQISDENNAAIIYDGECNQFSFAYQSGANPVRLNGQVIAFDSALNAYDILTIGKSRFLFLPLCGDRFTWDNV